MGALSLMAVTSPRTPGGSQVGRQGNEFASCPAVTVGNPRSLSVRSVTVGFAQAVINGATWCAPFRGRLTGVGLRSASMLKTSVLHPRITDLIYYNTPKLTAEEVVDRALAYRPIEL